ncbi:hypothetical protein [Nocardia sp. NPDC004722]
MKSAPAHRVPLLLATCALAALCASGAAQAAPPAPATATAIDGSTASGSGAGSSNGLFGLLCTLVHLSRGLPPGCSYSDMPPVG